MKKQYIISAIIALLVSVSAFFAMNQLNESNQKTVKIEHIDSQNSSPVLYSMNENGEAIPMNFTKTAEKVLDGVVHIKSSVLYENQFSQGNMQDPFRRFFEDDDMLEEFFGPRFRYQRTPKQQKPQYRIGTGSGVIINENGYIVTNNHVINNAEDIEVTLHDNRTYKAEVIGTDPNTDIALIKIREKNLPTIPFVNSDEVKVGEWVLAIGNPFSLNSTVTAGIVSAKGRNINILKEQYAVESFIQTDAAINPGNSGGALVNLNGGLIGINTAIASPTGAYSGYGFAVPSNIVNKVVEDLLNYGMVQRAVLGVMIRSVTGNLAKEKDFEQTYGAYIDSVFTGSAADKAGIKNGDIVISINDAKVESSPELQEIIARHRPGDEIVLKIIRKNKEKTLKVTLQNNNGEKKLVKKEDLKVLDALGCELKELDNNTARKLNIKGGVQVIKIKDGALQKRTRMREGFIITHVNNKPVKTVDELIKLMENKEGGFMFTGIYEDYPGIYYYAFGF